MAVYVASRFDPLTDIDRPVIGSKIVVNNRIFVIKEVDSILLSQLTNPAITMGFRGHHECRVRRHKTRPGVQWLVFGDYLKDDINEDSSVVHDAS